MHFNYTYIIGPQNVYELLNGSDLNAPHKLWGSRLLDSQIIFIVIVKALKVISSKQQTTFFISVLDFYQKRRVFILNTLYLSLSIFICIYYKYKNK